MIELLHSIWASAPTLLTIAVRRSDPSRTVRTCAAKNAAQCQTKYPTTGGSAVTQRKQNTREFYLRQIILKIGKYRKHRPDFRPEYVIMKSIGTSSKEEMKVKQD